MQPQQRRDIGMVGLDVMGRNLLLNLADHNFSVAGYDKEPGKMQAMKQDSAGQVITGAGNINDFMNMLKPPRAVIVLVPEGAPVDSVISDLLTLVMPGDLIIDVAIHTSKTPIYGYVV
jgi:6-phosphogluconate dehydrogenase